MKYVRIYADELKVQGKSVEIFDGDVIPDYALKEFDDFKKKFGKLTDEQLLKTKLYQENEKWIKKLIEEGYEILDLGDTHNLIKSVFYEMEKQLVFGN